MKQLLNNMQWISVSRRLILLWLISVGYLAQAQTVTQLFQSTAITRSDNADGRQVRTDPSGNIYYVGEFEGTIAIGSTTLVSAGGEDSFLAKYNAAGVFQWARRMGSTVDLAGLAVSSDGVYVSATFEGTIDFNTPSNPASNTLSSQGRRDVFI